MSAHDHCTRTSIPAGFEEFALVCCHVARQERSIRVVTRDEVGWTFACGGGGGDHTLDWWGPSHTAHHIELDGSICQVSDLRVGARALRFTRSAPWLRVPG